MQVACYSFTVIVVIAVTVTVLPTHAGGRHMRFERYGCASILTHSTSGTRALYDTTSIIGERIIIRIITKLQVSHIYIICLELNSAFNGHITDNPGRDVMSLMLVLHGGLRPRKCLDLQKR